MFGIPFFFLVYRSIDKCSRQTFQCTSFFHFVFSGDLTALSTAKRSTTNGHKIEQNFQSVVCKLWWHLLCTLFNWTEKLSNLLITEHEHEDWWKYTWNKSDWRRLHSVLPFERLQRPECFRSDSCWNGAGRHAFEFTVFVFMLLVLFACRQSFSFYNRQFCVNAVHNNNKWAKEIKEGTHMIVCVRQRVFCI